MSYIDTYNKQHSTVFSIYSDSDEINTNPEYQRNSDIWTKEKKQLLIDSIINRYDIPKIYFHKVPRSEARKSGYEYSIIDGRQRLETIWKFIDGDFPLNDDFVYLRNNKLDLCGLTYNDIAKLHPKIINKFNSSSLHIVVVETDDTGLIDDMFSRLNEAVPLNAAEKRNSIRGFCISAVNRLEKHEFYKSNVKFSNSRYQYRESVIRLLFIESCLDINGGKLIDTKKAYLDDFARRYKKEGKVTINKLEKKVKVILDAMNNIFVNNDKLLSSQAIVPIYFMVIRKLMELKKLNRLSRRKLEIFNKKRKQNRIVAEEDITKANFDLLEFDRMSMQGTNDASSIKERTNILLEYLI